MFQTSTSCRNETLHAALIALLVCLMFGVNACGDGKLTQGSRLTDTGANVASDSAPSALDAEPVAPDANGENPRPRPPGDAADDDAHQGDAGDDAYQGDAGDDAHQGDAGDAAEQDVVDDAAEQDISNDADEDTGPTCQDPDGDGYGDGEGCVDVDCNQSNSAIHPGQTEACNGYDDNCDGVIDEGCPTTTCTDDDGTCPAGCARANDNDCALDCRDPQGWPTSWAAFEDQVLLLSNQERVAGATCGTTYKPPVAELGFDAALREAARCHSMDMGLNNYFSHTDLSGGNFSDRANAANYADFPSGENISAGRPTPAQVVNAWMASEGHCNNIMRDANEELGVGFFFDSSTHYGEYWTQVFGIIP